MLIVGVCGSSAPSKRTRTIIETCLNSARECRAGITTDIVDLSGVKLEFADGRPIEEYSDVTKSVLDQIRAADAYIFGSPMYRGTITGALKNLIDLIPIEYIRGKAAGLLATGGSNHHYFGMDLSLRTVMNFFQVITLPGTLYFSKFTIGEGLIIETDVREQAEQFGRDLVRLVDGTSGTILGSSIY